MVLSQRKRPIGIFPSLPEAGKALNRLRDAGFPMRLVSLVFDEEPAKNQPQLRRDAVMEQLVTQARQGNTTGSVQGLVTGNKIGGAAGLLLGISTLAIPGIGHLILAGSAGTILAFTLSSGAIGAASGALIGGLVGLGVTEAQANNREMASQGDYLLMVEGTEDEIYRAESILNH